MFTHYVGGDRKNEFAEATLTGGGLVTVLTGGKAIRGTWARADKSKRLLGIFYQFTLTVGLTTEVKDAEVERIRAVCPDGLFDRLFRTVTKYKLADGATLALASNFLR